MPMTLIALGNLAYRQFKGAEKSGVEHLEKFIDRNCAVIARITNQINDAGTPCLSRILRI